MAATSDKTSVSEREIVISALIEGPRRLVYEAYTELRHLTEWFGPDGFSTSTSAFEFRVGGFWEFVMHGPDGVDYPNFIEWLEIVPGERIRYLHGERRGDPDAFESTVTFVEREGGTSVTMHSLFRTKARRDEVVEPYGAIEGGKQHLGRLRAYLPTMKGELAR